MKEMHRDERSAPGAVYRRRLIDAPHQLGPRPLVEVTFRSPKHASLLIHEEDMDALLIGESQRVAKW